MSVVEPRQCPACGGAGGGPIGRANSAWDIESYECPRCEGSGFVYEQETPPVARPGIAKTVPERAAPERTRRRSSSGS